MDSTLRIFLKTNSSLHALVFSHLHSKQLFQDECIFFYNQNCTSIEVRKKMEEFDEKMKTHVSKISLWTRSLVWPSGKMKSHLDFQSCKNKNLKIGFSPYILLIESFPDLPSYLKSDEQKLRYCILSILANSKIRILVSQLVELKISK